MRCSSAYNASPTTAAAAYMTMLIRRQCSISRSYISSPYNAATAVNANARSGDATYATTAYNATNAYAMQDMLLLPKVLLIRRRCSSATIAAIATAYIATMLIMRDLEKLLIKCYYCC